MDYSIINVGIHHEEDVVLARQRARELAALTQFDRQDQTRIATAVSELARNVFNYAGSGKVEFRIEGRTSPQLFVVVVSDRGPGIANLKEILDGRYRSKTGMGLGILGAQRLVDRCEIHTDPGKGTKILLKKLMPRHAPLITPDSLSGLVNKLSTQWPKGALQEVKQQNQELLRTLEELRERQEELKRLNRELEDTNRGVVALYAELDEKASHLRRADEMKSRFLSNMSHEFRTPVNSILALSGLLLDRTDGELTREQEKQVSFIRKGAESLLELVNDLLDLAKIEAGKIEVHPVEFSVANLFSALRGMLRPLLVSQSVRLVFEDLADIPPLYTDEGKVSQILRNFIANALKFTERGEIRVSGRLDESNDTITFAVSDTGPGIALQDQERIFEEFVQLDHPAQRNIKGTGLGLPLCRKLAGLLGGEVDLVSEVGLGSTFSVTLPLYYRQITDGEAADESGTNVMVMGDSSLPVLVLEDELTTRLIYEKFLRNSKFQFIGAASLREARLMMQQVRPSAIVLDILLRGEETWAWLAELKADPSTQAIPVLVVSTVADERKGLSLGADRYCVKPITRQALIAELQQLVGAAREASSADALRAGEGRKKLLIIDDEAAARYLMTRLLKDENCIITEADSGKEGLRLAQESRPDLVLLDLNMPDTSGYEVLARLKSHAETANIPVAVVTGADLTEKQQLQLKAQAYAVINKTELSAETLALLVREILPPDC